MKELGLEIKVESTNTNTKLIIRNNLKHRLSQLPVRKVGFLYSIPALSKGKLFCNEIALLRALMGHLVIFAFY